MNLRERVASSLESWANGFLPRLYKSVDYGHQWDIHITEVIEHSFEIAELIQTNRKLKLNPNIIYVAAAFHDIGLLKGRDGHEKSSALYIKSVVKEKLTEWFDEKEIKLIAEAVEDHRASVGRKARSVYGEIVADADKINSPEMLMLRCWLYRIKDIKEDLSNKDTAFEGMYAHILEKYGVQGYSKLQSPEGILINKVFRDEITKIANNKVLCRKLFDKMIASGELPKSSAVMKISKRTPPIYSKW